MLSDEYHRWYEKNRVWETTTWMGVSTWKLPMDAWILQEIIYQTKPEWIIETGTGKGGTALFCATILELLATDDHDGDVITIDVKNHLAEIENSRMQEIWNRKVKFIKGNSTDPDVVEQIRNHVGLEGWSTMVILDSWHTKDHVLEEMNIYSHYVSRGCYLIVEDTHVNGHPVEWDYKDGGPHEAVQEFLSKRDDFVVDKERERLQMTFNPGGYLRRVE